MIDLQLDADGIALLTIDQRERSMNVIDWALAEALSARLDELAAHIAAGRPPRGVIVTSGKTSFVAGADLAIMADMAAPLASARQAAERIGRIGGVLRRLELLGVPVVGACTGTALGGGLELLLACHHRIAADRPGAVLGLPEVTLGLLPGAGGTQRLPRLIGIAEALPLLLEGRPMTPARALALGIVDAVVPPDELLPAARQALLDQRARSVAPWDERGFALPGGDSRAPKVAELFMLTNGRLSGSHHGLQPALAAIASCVYEGSRLPIDRALRLEQMAFARLVQGPQAHAMIGTLFFARQAAEKAALRPRELPRTTLRSIAVGSEEPAALALQQAATAAGLAVQPADGMPAADLVVGHAPGRLPLRWYARPGLPPLLEITMPASADPALLARGFDLARQLRAVPVAVDGSRPGLPAQGFVAACIHALLDAAQALVADKLPVAVVANAALAGGWTALPTLAQAVGREWPAAPFERHDQAFDLSAISRRLADAVRRVALEGRRSGWLADDASADLAAVLGAGFPVHLGGPLRSADQPA